MSDNNQLSKKKIKSSLMLLLTSFIWGSAFVSQRIGLNTMGIHTFTATRFILAVFVLGVFIFVTDIKHTRKFRFLGNGTKSEKNNLLISGTVCGIILFAANYCQMAGLQYTTVGKAGFITVLYIIIVPILGLLYKKKIHISVWLSVMLALAGSYLLFIQKGFNINKGDLFILLSAFLFASHIMVIDHYTKITDSVRMAFIQFIVCGLISTPAMFLFENPNLDIVLDAWLPIAYAGILSSGVAYTFQFVAQKNLSAPIASIIMSMESVFAALAGWVIFKEGLSTKEILGCILIFLGIIIVQLPYKSQRILKRT